ncbi:type II toxin-antitoxin system HicA family toxin [Thermococcus sp. 21S9]|uniref:type II toxin-antitoxin system HicA family toxin n=1 Tax=Thermococcus sp. 21S9 TaxID=1638223 RepID=UPI00143C6DEE|nr:addiction module toxin, HicA family [Thermococcus sp. 21S9]
MRLPRDVSGLELIKALQKLNYKPVRQKGSHVVLVNDSGKMVVVPLHKRLKTGLLKAIMREVGITTDELLELLDDP